MSEKRRDNRNRILRNGESQRPDGRYMYKELSENNCCNCFRQKPGNTIKIAINLQQLFVDNS